MNEARLIRTRYWSLAGFFAFALPLVGLLLHAKHGTPHYSVAVLVLAMASYLLGFVLLLVSLVCTLWLKYRRGGIARASLYVQAGGLVIFLVAMLTAFGSVAYRILLA